MKLKVLLCSLLVAFLLIPSVAFAVPNVYGFDEETQVFNGTYDNWENFVYGLQPTDLQVASDAKGVLFVTREFGKGFFDSMLNGKPLVYGAWQYMHFYEYLEKDKNGWTWHNSSMMVYTQKPVDGAIAIEIAPNGYLNIIENDVWLVDAKGRTVRDEALVGEANEIILSQYPEDGFMMEPIHAIPQRIMKYLVESKQFVPGMRDWQRVNW